MNEANAIIRLILEWDGGCRFRRDFHVPDSSSESIRKAHTEIRATLADMKKGNPRKLRIIEGFVIVTTRMDLDPEICRDLERDSIQKGGQP